MFAEAYFHAREMKILPEDTDITLQPISRADGMSYSYANFTTVIDSLYPHTGTVTAVHWIPQLVSPFNDPEAWDGYPSPGSHIFHDERQLYTFLLACVITKAASAAQAFRAHMATSDAKFNKLDWLAFCEERSDSSLVGRPDMSVGLRHPSRTDYDAKDNEEDTVSIREWRTVAIEVKPLKSLGSQSSCFAQLDQNVPATKRTMALHQLSQVRNAASALRRQLR